MPSLIYRCFLLFWILGFSNQAFADEVMHSYSSASPEKDARFVALPPLAGSQYTVEHTWKLGLKHKWSVTPYVMGLTQNNSLTYHETSFLEFRYIIFQARLATMWLSIPNTAWSSSSLQQMQQKISVLPVGIQLPPFSVSWFRPYYFLHWSQGAHELGIEVDKEEFFNGQIGLRTSVQYHAPTSEFFYHVGISHGIQNPSGESFSDLWEDSDERRVGWFGLGLSYSNVGLGCKWSFFDIQYGFFQTSIAEGNITNINTDIEYDYVSFLPLGIVFPPVHDVVSFHYKFHWYPLTESQSNGLHTYGAGWHFGSKTSLLRTDYTFGVNDRGSPTSLFSIELELKPLLKALYGY